MAINLLVGAVTLLMLGFAVAWIFFPKLRAWMEAPKYRFLEQQRRFPGVVREPGGEPGGPAAEADPGR
jgi:hypothetical protein